MVMTNRRLRRWLLIVGGVVLFVVVGVIGGVLAQRATKQAEAPLPTAVAVDVTPVVPLKDCPWGEALCILALGVERALDAGNVDAVIDFGHVVTYVCPGEAPTGPNQPFPLCDGALTGELRQGYGVAERFGESQVVDREGYKAFIEGFLHDVQPSALDNIGTGDLRAYAMSCSQKAFPIQNVSCARAALILSAIVDHGNGPVRELLIFWAIASSPFQLGKGLTISEVWRGTIPDDQVTIIFQTGGTLPDLGIVNVVS